MFGAILKAINSSLQKGMTFCRSRYVKKDMKLLAFKFVQPSYTVKTSARKFLTTGQTTSPELMKLTLASRFKTFFMFHSSEQEV